MATLLELRTQVRDRADIEHSEFITDTELNRYINNSYKELYDLLTTAYEDYYTLGPTSFTVDTNTASASLPADFYKARGVDFSLDNGGTWITVQQFDFNRRNAKTYGNPWQAVQYRIVGSTIYITPVDASEGFYRIWYIPKAVEMVDDADTMDGVNGWEEYVIVDAAIKCKQKSEEEVGDLKETKLQLRNRILEASKNRDAGSPQVISDVNRPYYDNFFPWRL